MCAPAADPGFDLVCGSAEASLHIRPWSVSADEARLVEAFEGVARDAWVEVLREGPLAQLWTRLETELGRRFSRLHLQHYTRCIASPVPALVVGLVGRQRGEAHGGR